MLTTLVGKIERKIALRYFRRQTQANLAKYPQVCCYSFDHIAEYINFDGRYEKHELAFILEKMDKYIAGKTILDIGANIGNHTLAFAEKAKQVHAFEPHPITFQLLALNTGTHKNIAIHNFGASNAAQTLTAVSPVGNRGATSIANGVQTTNGDSGATVNLDLIQLDSLDAISNLQIDFIKIDVEGHEYHALRGLEKTLARCRPLIALEQIKSEIKHGTSDSLEFLKHHGYKFFYELRRSDRQRTPNLLPALLRVPLRLAELAIFGFESDAMELYPVANLEDRDYTMLFASPAPLVN